MFLYMFLQRFCEYNFHKLVFIVITILDVFMSSINPDKLDQTVLNLPIALVTLRVA